MERPVTIDEAVEEGKRLHQAGRLAEAERLYRRVLEVVPEHAESLHFLGVLNLQRGDAAGAVELIKKADQIQPGNGGYLTNLAVALMKLRRYAEAAEVSRRATQARPDLANAFGNLGAALKYLGRFDEAMAAFERAIALNPQMAGPHFGLGGVLFEIGSAREAVKYLGRALELDPGLVAIDSARLFMMGTLPEMDAENLLAEAWAWNSRHAARIEQTQHLTNSQQAGRQLNIGYVSGDFREHSVGRFMLTLLKNHDRAAVKVFCYSNAKITDSVTELLRGSCDQWRDIASETDERAAEIIRADEIDVLVDLSMHTAESRLLVLARRPAPVQISYLAYCGTTGVDAIGYRLSDAHLDPPGAEKFYSEKTLRLPESYWCYEASEKAGVVSELPALKTGHVTFGSLNNYFKINEDVLRAWAEILRQVKNARLLLHCPEGKHRESAERILGKEHVEFVGRMDLPGYFAMFNRMDMALDTFPYAGGTTTCDALWMGVPVVTLAGRTAVGRGGVSILSNVGCTEFIAETAQRYVEIAVRAAQDLEKLAALRRTMRERMSKSALMDAKRFMRGVEAAYRKAWEEWAAPGDLLF